MNMREYWANEAAMMRDKSAVLGIAKDVSNVYNPVKIVSSNWYVQVINQFDRDFSTARQVTSQTRRETGYRVYLFENKFCISCLILGASATLSSRDKIEAANSLPSGAVIIGEYHTHPYNFPDGSNNPISDGDLDGLINVEIGSNNVAEGYFSIVDSVDNRYVAVVQNKAKTIQIATQYKKDFVVDYSTTNAANPNYIDKNWMGKVVKETNNPVVSGTLEEKILRAYKLFLPLEKCGVGIYKNITKNRIDLKLIN